jgi:hypothetical protein
LTLDWNIGERLAVLITIPSFIFFDGQTRTMISAHCDEAGTRPAVVEVIELMIRQYNNRNNGG